MQKLLFEVYFVNILVLCYNLGAIYMVKVQFGINYVHLKKDM